MADPTRRAELAEARVAALASVAATLVVDQPLDATLTALLDTVIDVTAGVAAAIHLLDRETGELRFALTRGLPEGYGEGLRQAWAAGVRSPTAEALREQRARLVKDAVAAAWANPLYAPIHPFLDLVTWDEILVLPLDSLGRSLGSLNVYYEPASGRDDAEMAFLLAVADMGAVAVENSRLLGDLRDHAAVAERQRLARELHDSVSQALYGIALGSRTARTLLDSDPAAAGKPLDYVLTLAQAALTEMRSLIFALRPDALAAEGLVAALDRQVDALRVRHGIEVTTRLHSEPPLAAEAREAVYRIATEALHNITKHAQATRVDVTLDTVRDAVVLEVCDNGVGFDPIEPRPGHLGLQSMRERAAGCGGRLELWSLPGQGSRVTVRMPVAG